MSRHSTNGYNALGAAFFDTQVGGNIVPSVTNKWDIGRSDKRWKDFYVENLDVDGTIIATSFQGQNVPLNVLDFGADNTGATDNSTIIQTVVDLAIQGTNNSTILFPPGIYLIDSQINFFTNPSVLYTSSALDVARRIPVKLVGSGDVLLLGVAVSSNPMLNIKTGTLGLEIYNISFSRASATTLKAENSQYLKIKNCIFSGPSGLAIDLTLCQNFSISECNFRGGYGIRTISTATSDVNLGTSIIRDCRFRVANCGVIIAGTGNCTVSNNHFIQHTDNSSPVGVYLRLHSLSFPSRTSWTYPADNTTANETAMANVTVSENIFDGLLTGISCPQGNPLNEAASFARRLLFQNNRFIASNTLLGTRVMGIELNSYQNIIIRGNVFECASSSTFVAMYANRGQRLIIANNSVLECVRGFWLAFSNTDVTISNNNFHATLTFSGSVDHLGSTESGTFPFVIGVGQGVDYPGVVTNLTVSGNTARLVSGAGSFIYKYNETSWSNLVTSDNILRGFTGNGMSTTPAAADLGTSVSLNYMQDVRFNNIPRLNIGYFSGSNTFYGASQSSPVVLPFDSVFSGSNYTGWDGAGFYNAALNGTFNFPHRGVWHLTLAMKFDVGVSANFFIIEIRRVSDNFLFFTEEIGTGSGWLPNRNISCLIPAEVGGNPFTVRFKAMAGIITNFSTKISLAIITRLQE
jgi:hypothetical protein